MKGSKVKLKVVAALIILLIFIVIMLILLLNRKTYTITFDSNGGSLVAAVSVRKNDTVPKPEDPTREGYVFAGWYYKDELYDFNTPVTCDMELEAKWAIKGGVSGVKLNHEELTLALGETMQLIATIEPEDAENKEVLWSSSDPDVVSVDQNGNITALKEGSATIIVKTKEGGFTAKVNVTVIVENTEEPDNTENNQPNNNQTNNNNNQNNNNNNNNNQNNNNNNNNNDNNNNPTVVKVTGVSLNRTTLNLTEGESSKLTATVNPSNATNKNVTWSSSNSSIVNVDSNGNIKALRPGTATITVTTQDGNHQATCRVTVSKKIDVGETEIKVTGVSLNRTTLTLNEGDTEKLTATVNPSNATNKNVTWSSSNSSIVSVDSNGNIKALKPGTATITVTTKDGNHKATCQVVVNSYTITFTPYSQDATGAVMQYTVAVMKNNSSFSDYNKIIYNGKPVGTYLSSNQYNSSISKATILLKDGKQVTATVVYK